MSKKLDKSLLPQPQKPVGWKRGVLQIATGSRTDLNQASGEFPVTTKYADHKNPALVSTSMQTHQYNELKTTYEDNRNQNQANRQSRQSIQNTNNQRVGMTESQYSLEQKELLTFAANHSNQDEDQINSRYQTIKESPNSRIAPQTQQKRTNRFSQSQNNQHQHNLSSSPQSSQHTHANRSSSKNKEHKSTMYRHNMPQNEEFIAYSVVTKESKSGMFSNEKLLMINSFKRQLIYFSKLPKLLPFASFSEMQKKYLIDEKPKQIIQLDKVRRFMFVPAKGSLASVAVSYVNEKGERKEWKLGMGNNSLMSEWIQLVNQVFKKQHYSIVKSQVKYPPKPKKEPQNKSNNYETKFTKTLKQQVLPAIKQSSIRTSRANDSQMNQSTLSASGLRSTKNAASLSNSKDKKQYVVDKSKFVNTKSYLIDMEDVSNEDIFYVPEPIKQEEVNLKESLRQQASQSKKNNNQNSHNQIGSKYWHGVNQYPEGNSRFSEQLQQRQRQINNEHNNRISTYIKQKNDQQQRIMIPEPIPQPIVLSKKTSGDRLSQTTHKDLNIHIDSRIAFEEMEREKELVDSHFRNDQTHNISTSHVYEPFSKVNTNAPLTTSNANKNANKNVIRPIPVQFYEQKQQPRKRVYTQVIEHQRPIQIQQNQKLTFINNSESLLYSSSSHYQQSPKHTPKTKYRLQQPPRNLQTIDRNRSNSYVTQNSQIEDIIVGGKLHEGYILNFSPHSFSNNWFRLWLETEPVNRADVYASFVRACRSLVKRLIDTPQNFVNCYTMEKNNTHITFSLQNITFKLPFKLPLPQGLGEFISVMDFIRSQDFISQVFKYQTQICDEYYNYKYILNQLSTEFNSGVLSLPIYFPMCCLVMYKGISVICKANVETANLNCIKVSYQELRRYEKEIEYVEDVCHVKFELATQNQKPFDLYSVYLPSFQKSIIYMDNLERYLPSLPNPLHKNPNPCMQLNGSYIQQHIKKGMISSAKDIDEIEKHLIGNVIKIYGNEVLQKGRTLISGKDLAHLLYEKGGLREEYLGLVYRRVEEREQKLNYKSTYASSLILTQIVIKQYSKACHLYFMKQYFKQLYTSISQSSQNNSKNNPPNRLSTSQASNNSKTMKNLQSYTSIASTFGQSYSSNILEMLHYLIYRNSKVWNVISVALDEKYGVSEFRRLGNQRQIVDVLMGRICLEYLVLGLLENLGVEAEVKSWSSGMTWGTLPLTQDSLSLVPYPKATCYQLGLFNPQYTSLITQLTQISSASTFSSVLTSKNFYSAILQILNISQESYQNQSTLIKSASYELLQHGFANERQLIDLALSYFIPTLLKPNKSTKLIDGKQKCIELYEKLLNQQLVRNSKDVSVKTFDTNFNGIKWLIKQNQFELAQVLIEEQLQAISIWYTESLLQTKCKFLDLAAVFYHKKLANRNNLGIEYAIKSLQLAMQNKSILPLSTCAQKCFQAANIHFECGYMQKSLELYELAQEFVFQSQRNKSLQQTDLSIEFIKIYLRKAEIKLAMGKKNETLYQCLQCLRKCEEFEDLLTLDQSLVGQEYMQVEKDKQELAEIQINVFELMFRCYQVTKNLNDMERITQLCCNKFIQDKVIILRITKNVRNKDLQDSVNPSLLSKLLKMCWISLINNISSSIKNLPIKQQHLSKTFTIPSSTRKSFCLTGALSQSKKSPQLNQYQKLQELMEKLEALCKLYPKKRYDHETLAMFVCREIVETSSRISMGKNVTRGEYQIIGSKRKGVMSSRVEEMISAKRQNQGQVMSVLYERLSQVIKQLTDQQGEKSHKRIQRYQTESSSAYYQRRGSRQKQSRYQSIQHHNHAQTSTKKQVTKFYQSPETFTSDFDPYFSQTNQDQPELRMSFILGRQEQQDSGNLKTYDIYSLKDEMDRKYMLMEAMFGLCGREFVLGCLQEAIEREMRKGNGPAGDKVFYE